MQVELWYRNGTSMLPASFSLWLLRPSSTRCKRSSAVGLYPLHPASVIMPTFRCAASQREMSGYCTQSLTGSWSKGRNRYYAYYHCQDGCTSVTKDAMEGKFGGLHSPLAAQCRIHAAVPRNRAGRLAQKAGRQPQQIQNTHLRARSKSCARTKTKLEEAFVYQKSVAQPTYQEMRTKLSEDLTLAEMELRDAQAEEIEIETVLNFAAMVLTNASNLWKTAPAEQKQRLQQVLLPEGVTYSEGKYGTAVTCLLFSGMGKKRGQK